MNAGRNETPAEATKGTLSAVLFAAKGHPLSEKAAEEARDIAREFPLVHVSTVMCDHAQQCTHNTLPALSLRRDGTEEVRLSGTAAAARPKDFVKAWLAKGWGGF